MTFRVWVDSVGTQRVTAIALISAAVLGVTHGVCSIYWGLGGHWLVATLGERIVSDFAGYRWTLIPIGLAKIGFALLPLLLAAYRWPARRWGRSLCWLGAIGLALWGGINTVIGNLVLSGVIRPDGGYDHDAMAGHAWLWDPLFLLWGLCLGVGLAAGRTDRVAAEARS